MAKKRILKDCTNSEKVNKLSPGAEIFFYRLIMKADDFGSFYANEKLLLANLFPLKIEDISPQTVLAWKNECVDNELLINYSAGGKDFIRIISFGQRLRDMRNKFPDPPDSPQVAASRRECPPELEEKKELEVELEGKGYQPEDIEKKIIEIKNAGIWIEAIAKNYRQSVEAAGKHLEDFLTEQKLKEDLQKPISEIKRHFINWLKLKFEKEQKEQAKSNSKNNSTVSVTPNYEASL